MQNFDVLLNSKPLQARQGSEPSGSSRPPERTTERDDESFGAAYAETEKPPQKQESAEVESKEASNADRPDSEIAQQQEDDGDDPIAFATTDEVPETSQDEASNGLGLETPKRPIADSADETETLPELGLVQNDTKGQVQEKSLDEPVAPAVLRRGLRQGETQDQQTGQVLGASAEETPDEGKTQLASSDRLPSRAAPAAVVQAMVDAPQKLPMPFGAVPEGEVETPRLRRAIGRVVALPQTQANATKMATATPQTSIPNEVAKIPMADTAPLFGIDPLSPIGATDDGEPLGLILTQAGQLQGAAVAAMSGRFVPQTTAQSVAQQVATAIVSADGETTEIELSPRELGKVRIAMTPSEIGVSVVLMAERPETADLMRKHLDALMQEFMNLGYQDISFSFAEGDGTDSAPAQADQTNAGLTDDPDDVMLTGIPIHMPLSRSALDLKL